MEQHGVSLNPTDVCIVSAVRTPLGAFQGALSHLSATDLGAIAIQAALERAHVTPDMVQEVFMGNVLSANLGQAPAQQAAFKAGLPSRVPATTVNKVCSSGMKAVMFAEQSIRLGINDIVVAGGMESMSNVPHYMPKSRSGVRLGHWEVVDGLIKDGLWDPYNDIHMGSCAEICAEKMGFSRAQQDEHALSSHERARHAQAQGWTAWEVARIALPEHHHHHGHGHGHGNHNASGSSSSSAAPAGAAAVAGSGRGGAAASAGAPSAAAAGAAPSRFGRTSHDNVAGPSRAPPESPPNVVEWDEAPTKMDPAKLPRLKPYFRKDGSGTVTAGNASPMTDGAAALVLASGAKALALGLPVLAVLRGAADANQAPEWFTTAPALAAPLALQRAGLSQADIDYWEINEAFSVVDLANRQLLGLREDRVNVHGGAVALGHPIGASGARILVTLINVLHTHKGRYGCAAICNGGGGASAVVLEAWAQQSRL